MGEDKYQVIKVHVVIPGNMQDIHHWTGSARLVEEIAAEVSNGNPLTTRVFLYPWHANWRRVATRIWWLGEYHQKRVAVNIYGYSWGGGWGSKRLAYELSWLGVDVHNMTLADPIYRHWYPLGNWRVFTNHWSLKWLFGDLPIKIPCNVKRVRWTRQQVSYPRAHKLVADCESTIIDTPELLNVSHLVMDEHPAYHRLALEAARSLHSDTELEVQN